jgi:predicted RNA binding protein YcfA (HicA-like mRNA interferase family)
VKYREISRILLANGFSLKRQDGSHRQYEGHVDGRRRLVTVAFHGDNEDVRPRSFASIIRQSGLPRSKFR